MAESMCVGFRRTLSAGADPQSFPTLLGGERERTPMTWRPGSQAFVPGGASPLGGSWMEARRRPPDVIDLQVPWGTRDSRRLLDTRRGPTPHRKEPLEVHSRTRCALPLDEARARTPASRRPA